MEGRAISYKDPDFIGGFEVLKRLGEAPPVYSYLIRNPKNPEDRAVSKYFDLKSLAGFGISKLEAVYYISDVLDFLDLGIVGVLRRKENIIAETNNICFEFVEDKTLFQIVKDGTLDAPDALEICRKVALVLREAEREGFFHLALNPKNIFISREGGVTIKDWILCEQNVALFSIPQKLEFDTYYFQAPELLDMKGVSASADIYSLGLLAAFMVTFDWRVKESLSNGVKIPREVRGIVVEFASEDPGERVGDWDAALKALSGGKSITAAAVSAEDKIAENAEEISEPEEARVPEEEEPSSEAYRLPPKVGEGEIDDAAPLAKPSLYKRLKGRELSRKTLAAIISVLAGLFILGVVLAVRPFIAYEPSYTAKTAAQTLPSFVGRSYDEAAAIAEELGITLEMSEEHDQEAAGTVIAQEPGADEEITDGMVVKLTVSLGPEESGVQSVGVDTGTVDSSTGDDAAAAPAPEPAPAPKPVPAPTPGSRPVVTASASPSSGPSSGVMVTLSASAYDPDGGSIVSYSWSCGGSGATISREFASSTAPTTVTVTVTVTDDEGQTASASVSIQLY